MVVPLSEGVLHYYYVVLSNTQPRSEARVSDRAISLGGLKYTPLNPEL